MGMNIHAFKEHFINNVKSETYNPESMVESLINAMIEENGTLKNDLDEILIEHYYKTYKAKFNKLEMIRDKNVLIEDSMLDEQYNDEIHSAHDIVDMFKANVVQYYNSYKFMRKLEKENLEILDTIYHVYSSKQKRILEKIIEKENIEPTDERITAILKFLDINS